MVCFLFLSRTRLNLSGRLTYTSDRPFYVVLCGRCGCHHRFLSFERPMFVLRYIGMVFIVKEEWVCFECVFIFVCLYIYMYFCVGVFSAKPDSFVNVTVESCSMFCKVCGVQRFGSYDMDQDVITLHRFQIARVEAIRTVSVCSSAVRYDVEHGHNFLAILTDKTVASRFDDAVVAKDVSEAIVSTPVCYRDGEYLSEVCRFSHLPASLKNDNLQHCRALGEGANFECFFHDFLRSLSPNSNKLYTIENIRTAMRFAWFKLKGDNVFDGEVATCEKKVFVFLCMLFQSKNECYVFFFFMKLHCCYVF